MASFEIPADGDGNPYSAFARGLNGRRIPLAIAGEVTHPCRAIAFGAAKFERSLSRLVTELEKSDFYTAENEGSESDILSAFEDLCYTATEFFDVYAQAVPATIDLRPNKGLKSAEAHYRNVVKKRRNDWSLICNKIKHNHNVLAPVRQVSKLTGETVRGFSLCRPYGAQTLRVNTDLHGGGERSRQFDLAVRQVIHDLLRCDLAAAEIVDLLPDTSDEALVTPDVKLNIGGSLAKLSSREVLAGDNQPTMYDGFDVGSGKILFSRRSARMLRGQIEISVVFRGDGMTRTFEMI
jgi:hypothetical protein